MTTLVFDATALSHFARAGRLAELEKMTSADNCSVPTAVLDELARGVAVHPALGTVAAQSWLHPVEVDDFEELAAFARYKGELGGGPEKNNGEAAVLARVTVQDGVAIIDEDVARSIGEREKIPVQGSLWLVVRALRSNVLDRATAEAIVDDLLSTGMWLPIGNGAALFAWAYTAGLLP